MNTELAKHFIHRLSNSLGVAMNALYLMDDPPPGPMENSLYLAKSELVLFRHLLTQDSSHDFINDLKRVLSSKSIELAECKMLPLSAIVIAIVFAECTKGGKLQITYDAKHVQLKYSRPIPEPFQKKLNTSPLNCYIDDAKLIDSNTCHFTTS